jgi:hypothetical protein
VTEDSGCAPEIGQLEQELENLLDSYRVLENNVWWLKVSFGAFVVALIGLVVFGAIVGSAELVVASIAFLAISALAVWIGPVDGRLRRVRWIDLVGWQPPGILGVGVKRSEAMAIEDMIADRLDRLAQLRGRS